MPSNAFVERVESFITRLPTDGPVEPQDVSTWFYFLEYLVNLLESQGLFLRGYSFKSQGWSWLLVVKVVWRETPQVAFTTERNPTGCMRVFLRKLGDETVNWQVDRFA